MVGMEVQRGVVRVDPVVRVFSVVTVVNCGYCGVCA